MKRHYLHAVPSSSEQPERNFAQELDMVCRRKVSEVVQAYLETVTLQKDGSVTMSGSHTQFPSFEAYSYGNTGKILDVQYTEDPKQWYGPVLLSSGEDRKF